MKNWSKGRFGFWFYTKTDIRNRDAIMARFMEAQGMRKERERIIKLLETECCEMKNYQQSMGIHWALALIKGENK